jgi:hypothetical protein
MQSEQRLSQNSEDTGSHSRAVRERIVEHLHRLAEDEVTRVRHKLSSGERSADEVQQSLDEWIEHVADRLALWVEQALDPAEARSRIDALEHLFLGRPDRAPALDGEKLTQ